MPDEAINLEVLGPPAPNQTEKEKEMPSDLQSHFTDRLMADRDRHSTNATSFEKMMEMSYARGQEFRDANAARIVMEAGSGRTRAESNAPNNTAAQRDQE